VARAPPFGCGSAALRIALVLVALCGVAASSLGPLDSTSLALDSGASGACQRWLATFGGQPASHSSFTLAAFDDGSGPALYAGGHFSSAGGVPAHAVARWDGRRWSVLGRGIGGLVHALAEFDDGSGPALYAAGNFTSIGGVSAHNIARWDGTSWSALGSGLSGGFGFVAALSVFDDGSGPALYAGGAFRYAGAFRANGMARWDGTSWSPLGSGTTGVYALAVFDDGQGGGPALYAGGEFFSAGGVPAIALAKWDGTSWSALEVELDGFSVAALTVFDDGSGSGPALYVGGNFTKAGGILVNGVARWDGSGWSALGAESTSGAGAFAVFDDGSGKPALHAAGRFATGGGVTQASIGKWDGSSWSALGRGFDGAVLALTEFVDGAGRPALVAGGFFTNASGVAANRIALWDGSGWSPLGFGMNGSVLALAVFDEGNGSGPALFAAGSFTFPGFCIARWNGATWSHVGGGAQAGVLALAVFDDGSGPALFAGGRFFIHPGSHIAQWNGSSWSNVGIGVSYDVHALTVFDAGTGRGPALIAAGSFSYAGGMPASHIAQWDGSTWSPLGSGLDGAVHALAAGRTATGSPLLYAGGEFAYAGSVAASNIARWDGTCWSALGAGVDDEVLALAVRDEGGSGHTLLVAGKFISAGGAPARRLAAWDGSHWSTLDSGMDRAAHALSVLDDGSLFVGGEFTTSAAGDSFLARRACPEAKPVERRATPRSN
jgi:hypothetical protein